MPEVSDETTSERLEKRPDIKPKATERSTTPKATSGTSERLKAEGNRLPVAERSTAWGTAVSMMTTPT